MNQAQHCASGEVTWLDPRGADQWHLKDNQDISSHLTHFVTGFMFGDKHME